MADTNIETLLNLKGTNISPTSNALTWNVVPGAINYIIYRSNTLDGTYDKIGETSTTTYLDENLTPNTTYYYKLMVVDEAGGENEQTSPLEITTSVDGLPAPNNVIVTPRNCHSLLITWDYVDDASSYNIYQALTEDGTYTLVGTATGNQFIVDNLIRNTTYYYKVAAVNDSEGTMSTANSATTSQNCPECCKRVCYLSNSNGCLYRCCYYTHVRCVCCD